MNSFRVNVEKVSTGIEEIELKSILLIFPLSRKRFKRTLPIIIISLTRVYSSR